MPRDQISNTFIAGEWSPLTLGMKDQARYQQCAEEIENALVLIQGGVTRRWGTHYRAAAKFPSLAVRCMPWRFSVSQTYLLELGNNYARFYTNSAQIEDPSVPGTPLEAATPWTAAQLVDLEWVQYADTAIIVHPNVVPYRITRVSSTLWKIQAAPFIVFPSSEIGLKPAAGLTLSALTGAITLTASAASFLLADVGRPVVADLGEATITGFTSTTVVNATVVAPFLGLTHLSGAWTILESPKTTLTLTAINNRLNGGATLTLGAAGWRASDVGSYVIALDGEIEIIGFTSTTVVTGRIREVLSNGSTTLAGDVIQSEAWSVEPKTWSAARGYPRAVGLYEQRLIFAGSAAEPLSLWASPPGRIYDLSRGVRAASGFAQSIVAYDMSTIMHLVAAPTTLLALTASAEMSAGAGNDDALTATNIRPRAGSLHGSSSARPVFVGTDLIMAQAGGTKLRALAYQLSENALWAPDITWQSEHLFRSGSFDLAYSAVPQPQLYCVTGDGNLNACGLYRNVGVLEHDVLAWTHQTTQGEFLSCATIREGNEDQLWLAVRRTINGSPVTYIETADYTLHTDCAITGSGPANTVWSGFAHLEGEEVMVKGDGIKKGLFTVSGGQITLPEAVTSIEAGFEYDSSVTIPDIEIIGGTIGGSKVRVHEVLVDVLDTIGLEVAGDDLRWNTFGPAVLDSAPAPFTGQKAADPMGWNRGRVRLRQLHPYNWTVRRVTRRYVVNAG